MDQTALTDREPQGVIQVTEHNAEVNPGFTVLRGSNHTPPLWEEDWRRIPLYCGVSQEPVLHEYIESVVAAYWEVVSTMVSNGRDDRDMTPAECQAWIQTGLALAPFCGHRMDTSLDWAVAWSLVDAEMIYQYVVHRTVVQGWVSVQFREHVTVAGATSRSQWTCYQFLLNALAWSNPDASAPNHTCKRHIMLGSFLLFICSLILHFFFSWMFGC